MTFAATIIASLFIGLVIGFFIRGRRALTGNDHALQEQTVLTSQHTLPTPSGIFALSNEVGEVEIYGSEIRRIPNGAHHLDLANEPIKKVTQLLADSLKAVTGTSKRTIEIVFKPEIQHGITEGTYRMMHTKTGEVLADAIDSTGKIVGKGRVVEAGKMRQLATGAFQIISIAVAQSHLADIERSLDGINRSLAQLQNSIDNAFIANISGPLKYLNQIAERMKSSALPDNLSDPQKNTLEAISKDAYIALAKIEEDLKTLMSDASKIVNKEILGTSDCYQELKEVTQRFEKINVRKALLVELASLTNIVMAYQDPTNKIFTRVAFDASIWRDMLSDFSITFLERSNALLSNRVKTNSEEILTFRRETVQNHFDVCKTKSFDMIERFEKIEFNLNKNSQKFLGQETEVALAFSLDSNGIVEYAAVL